MKHNFKSNEIAHIWSHRSAPYGKCSSNMSFDGDVFKSYGTAIGRLGKHKGESYVLLNSRSFSVSTSKHQSYVRRAVSHFGVQFHGDFGGMGTLMAISPKGIVEHYIDEANQIAKRVSPRKVTMAQNKCSEHYTLTEALRAAKFFGLGTKAIENRMAKLQVVIDSNAELLAEYERKLQAQRDTRDERMAASRERQRQANAIREAEHIAEWRAGEYHGSLYNLPVMLRVEKYMHPESGDNEMLGAEIVTSMGARIPYADGKRAFEFAIKLRERGWRKNGEHCPVGNYELDAINEAGVVAGCHRISWVEIEKLAQAVGWITPPSVD